MKGVNLHEDLTDKYSFESIKNKIKKKFFR